MKSASNGGVLKGHLQVLHIHVLLVATLGTGYMAQPGTDHHKGRVTVRKTAHHTSAAADLPVQPLNDIVGADASPVLAGKVAVGKSLFDPILHLLSGLFQLHGAQFFHHSLSLFSGSSFALLRMDRPEHLCYQLHLRARRRREHIAVEVDRASLVFGLRKHFSHSLQHTEAFVSHNEFRAIQAAAAEPLQEADAVGLVFFHALGSTKNLTVSVLIDRNRYQNGYIFKLSTPVAAQIDPST